MPNRRPVYNIQKSIRSRERNLVMALSYIFIKHLKPENKKYSVSDGRGLIIEVRPNGSKYWVIRYWVDGKEKRKHIGSYPEISLKEARVKAVEERSRTLTPETPSKIFTFGEIAEEWFAKRMKDKKMSYLRTIGSVK